MHRKWVKYDSVESRCTCLLLRWGVGLNRAYFLDSHIEFADENRPDHQWVDDLYLGEGLGSPGYTTAKKSSGIYARHKPSVRCWRTDHYEPRTRLYIGIDVSNRCATLVTTKYACAIGGHTGYWEKLIWQMDFLKIQQVIFVVQPWDLAGWNVCKKGFLSVKES